MLSVLSPSELLTVVFGAKIKDEQQFNNLPSAVRNVLGSKSKLPILSNSDLRSITKLAKENDSIQYILPKLTSFNSVFHSFQRENLEILIRNCTIMENSPDASALFIFYFFFEYLSLYNKNNYNYKDYSDDLKILFSSLVTVLNCPSQTFKCMTKARTCACTCFILLFNFSIDNYQNDMKDEFYSMLFGPLSQFLTLSLDLPSECFSILLKIGNTLIKPNELKLSKTASTFLNFVVIILRTCENRFPTEISQKLISVLRMALIGLDEAALLFFSRCIDMISRDDSTPIIVAFPTAIATIIETNGIIKRFTDVYNINDNTNEKNKELPVLPQKVDTILYSTSEHTILPQDLFSAQKPSFSDKENNDCKENNEITFLPPEIIAKLTVVSKVVESSNEMKLLLINFVYSAIKELEYQPHSNELIAAYITLLTQLSPIPSEIVYALFSLNRIFDQRITYLRDSSDYKCIHILRKMFTIFLLKQKNDTIQMIFEMMRTKPYLWNDFAYRCTPKYIPKDAFKFSIEQVAISVAYASYFFQSSESGNDILVPVLTRSRICCFQVLEEIFKYDQFLIELFSSAVFVKCIFAFLFEEPPRKFLLKYLLDYFRIFQNSSSNCKLTDHAIKTFQMAFQKNYTTYSFTLFYDVISFLDVSVSNNPELAKVFEPLIPDICSYIAGMPHGENGIKVLLQTVSMFSAFISYHRMTQSDISAIETASKKMFGDKNSSQLKNKLICLISGQVNFISAENINNEANFIIKQPKALRLLLALFYEKSILTFLIDLCKFSPLNSFMCRNGQLDIFVLEKLYNLRTEDNFPMFELLLNLFVEISKVCSSVSAVNQFTSLFTAINGKFISQYQYMLLSALSTLCDFSKEIPVSILYDSNAIISNVSSSKLKNQFMVCFWMLNASKDTNQQILNVNSNAVNFEVNEDNHIFVYFGEQQKQKFSQQIPLNKWQHIALAVKTKKKNTYCFLALNGIYIEFLKFPSQPLGKITDFLFKSSTFLFIGSFGVYPYAKLRVSKKGNHSNPLMDVYNQSLSTNDKPDPANFSNSINPNKLFNVSCREMLSIPNLLEPIVYITPHSQNSTMKLEVNTSKHSISAYAQTKRCYDIISFVDVIIERCGICLLLPLFAETSFEIYQKEKQTMNYSDKLVEVIKKLFLINPNIAQKGFEQDKGFKILSYLLKVSSTSILSYEMYNSLYNLYKENQNNLRFKEQFLINVIYNIELWIQCDLSSVSKILFHWGHHTLFKSDLDILTKELSFTNLLTILRRYFWFEITEDDISFLNRFSDPNYLENYNNPNLGDKDVKTNIKNCRKALYYMLNLIVKSKGITDIDITYLVAQIVTVKERLQREDLADLLISLIKDDLVQHPETLEMITCCVSYSDFAIPLIKAILEKAGKLNSTITLSANSKNLSVELVQIMIRTLNKNFVCIEQIDPLYKMLKEIPAVLPIVSMVSFNLGYIHQLIQDLPPNYCDQSEFWHLWMIVTLFLGTASDSPLQFLTRTPSKCWLSIYLAIDFVGRFLKKDTNDNKKKFLNTLAASGSINTVEKSFDFLFVCRLFLFFRANDQDMSHLLCDDSSDSSAMIEAQPRNAPASINKNNNLNITNNDTNNNDNNSNKNSNISNIKSGKSGVPMLDMNKRPPTLPHVPIASPRSPRAPTVNLSPLSPRCGDNVNSSTGNNNDDENGRNNADGMIGKSKMQRRPPTASPKINIIPSAVSPPNTPLPQHNAALSGNRKKAPNKMSRRSTSIAASVTYGDRDDINNKEGFQKILPLSQAGFDEGALSILKSPPLFRFTIRLNKELNWVDIDVAESALKIWAKFKSGTNNAYNDFALLILAYLLPNIAKYESYLSQINFNEMPKNSAYSLYCKRCAKYKLPTILTPDEYIPLSFEYLSNLDNHANELYIKFLDSFQKSELSGLQKHKEISSKLESEFVMLVGNIAQTFCAKSTTNETSNAKEWNHLWHQMTIENAPWYHSLPPEHRKENHYRRDTTMCFCFCPFKECKNFEFDDHLKESFVRDSGDSKAANIEYDKHIARLKLKYENSEPPEIFNVIEEPEDSENAISNISDSKLDLECEVISLSKTVSAILYLKKDEAAIIGESVSKVIPYNSINYIFRRTVLHRQTAIEIFQFNGDSIFINFPKLKAKAALKEFEGLIYNSYDSDYNNNSNNGNGNNNSNNNININNNNNSGKSKNVSNKISNLISNIVFIQNDKFMPYFQSKRITESWVNGLISNFEYLVLLNIYSGRSFNCTAQYPLMPWILTNYSVDKLDLNNEEIFRDLSKPIGVLDEDKLSTYKDTYMQYKDAGIEPFMFSSAPISPLSLYLYLLRQEPFTTLHTEMQSGRFDNPARLFASISSSFETIKAQIGDFRELVAEFYFSPEFLENKNHFDLGKVNGKAVNNVELPNWAENSFDFIYKHRKALESNFVSKHLNEWIDLIWGVKQRSFESNNVYKSEMYSDIWKKESAQDLNNWPEIEAILSLVGQIPQPLFNSIHPKKNSCCFGLNESSGEMASSSSAYKARKNITAITPIKIETESKILGGFCQSNKIISIDENGYRIITEVDSNRQSLQNRPKSFMKRLASIALSSNSDPLSLEDSPNSASNQDKFSQFHQERQKIPGFSKIHNKAKSAEETNSVQTLNYGGDFNGEDDSRVVFVNIDQVVVVGNMKNDTFCISLNNMNFHKLMENKNETVAVAADGQYIAAVDSDAILTVYNTNSLTNPLFSIPSYQELIKCLSVSSAFHLIVCGTKDSSLLFCSINSESFIKNVDLEGKIPMMILLTTCWCFSVVQTKVVEQGQRFLYLSLFSVNGEKLKETKITLQILKWAAFRSRSGFDFIVASDEKMDVYAFEAYCLDDFSIKDRIHHAACPIVSLSFLESEEAIVVITEDGRAVFIPFKF